MIMKVLSLTEHLYFFLLNGVSLKDTLLVGFSFWDHHGSFWTWTS